MASSAARMTVADYTKAHGGVGAAVARIGATSERAVRSHVTVPIERAISDDLTPDR